MKTDFDSVLKNNRVLLTFSEEELEEFKKKSGNYTFDMFGLPLIITAEDDISYLSGEDAFKVISASNEWMYYYVYHSRRKLDDLKIFMHRIFDMVGDTEQSEKLKKYYDTLKYEPFVSRNEYLLYYKVFEISKLLIDDRIMSTNSLDVIEEYRIKKGRGLLIDILSRAYGNHVREMFNERPNLNIDNLKSFAIFDKKIYRIMGKQFVNFAITYELGRRNCLIYEMSRDEELLKSFKNSLDEKYF